MLDQADNGMPLAGTHKRIALPMSQMATFFIDYGSFGNSPSINDLTPPTATAAITLTALLLASQMAPKIASEGFINIDVALEGLMADGDFCSNLIGDQLALQMPYSR